MIYKIFSVYDSAAEAYLQPFFMPTKGEALRGFSEVVNDKNHQFGRHPDDYTLFELGEYDNTTAVFVMHSAPKSLGVAIEFVKSAALTKVS
jgi:hypothetical protein